MKPAALVIENDGGTRKLLHVLVSRCGVETDVVATGSDALVLLELVEYDLIFLELVLRGTSGLDVLRWMERERPALLSRSVVVSSAPPVHLQQVALQWPQVRVIRKPFEVTEVAELAQSCASGPARRSGSPAEEFVRRSVRAGAKSGVVAVATDTHFVPLTSFGYPAMHVQSYFPLPVDAPFPLCTAYRSAQPVWIASLASAAGDYPELTAVWQKNDSRALAAVPLVRDGVPVGAAGWTFREARLFSAAEQQQFESIAALLADSIPLPGERQSAPAAHP